MVDRKHIAKSQANGRLAMQPKSFISDSSADPDNYPIWIQRGERLGDAILAFLAMLRKFQDNLSNLMDRSSPAHNSRIRTKGC
jgi:hypothetical protein